MNDIELLQILLIPTGKKRGGRGKEKVKARRKKGRGTRDQKRDKQVIFMGSRLKLYSLSVEFFINLIEPREGWLVRATESMMEIH